MASALHQLLGPWSSEVTSSYNRFKYFGYLITEGWLHQKALDLGYPPAQTPEGSYNIRSAVPRNVMAAAGVLSYARVRRIKTPKGKHFLCIALACDDPITVGERMSTHAPPEANYKALKEAMGKDGPAHWYRAR
ncbi:uncharacterized protein F5891DRAFT_977289 [Suillus fuscotomentosus]|uniref:Uncharacterized protein n=1 Tax=Suillus fuscotomentosus TaxID=1912939 RepID=A0AAD4EDU3_9AGAM|nr:uncharacterized protein F5891DRAFT_977289 [Suillus fuscotomentosus]KAG1904435.1 hypothetical protein F5891DRAFT_977289 [Suillus fuscotomentosus]